MKIVNTYKQGSITWFEYKILFSCISTVYGSKEPEGILAEWIDGKLIAKRTKDTV